MSVTRNYQGRHRGTQHHQNGTRGRRGFGFAMVATLACAALVTAWPTPRYN